MIGREAKIQQVEDLVAGGARCVTLLGPGGIGKTSLARAWLALQDTAVAGELFCDLTAVTQPDAIADHLARVMGVGLPTADTKRLDQVANALRVHGHRVIVLDNCEHLIEGAARLVAELVRRTEVTIVATSREVLGLSSETRVDVGPLDAEDACTLFVERARRVRPDWMPTDDERPILKTLVERLDRLPLAIELCAARITVFTLSRIQERLDDRFALLVSNLRDVPERHATMRCVVDTSLDAVDAAQRQAFLQCSVFRDGFTLASAERVLDDEDVARVLQQLVERSLLVTRSGTDDWRFNMLTTLSDYAMRELDEEQHVALRDRHAAYFAELGERLRGETRRGDARAAWAALEEEQANLSAAFDWTCGRNDGEAVAVGLALHELFVARGRTAEDQALTQRLVRLAERSEDGVRRAWAGWARSQAVHRGGDPEAARAACRSLLEADAIAHSDTLRSAVNLEAGICGKALGALEEARGHLTRAWRGFEALEDARGQAAALRHLGGIARYEGDLREAIARLDAAIVCAREAEDATTECAVLIDLATAAALSEDDRGRAAPAYQRALALTQELGDVRGELLSAGGLATITQMAGPSPESGALWRRAVTLARTTGSFSLIAYTASGLANWCREVGDMEEAAQLFEEALGSAHGVPHVYVTYEVLNSYAAFLADQDALASARATVERAAALFEPQQDSPEHRLHEVAVAFVRLAEARAGERDVVGSVDHARALADDQGNPSLVVDARLLRRAIMRTESSVGLMTLTVGPEARWFVFRSGEVVSLSKHRVLPRLLAFLVRHHEQASACVPPEELIAAGWPDEKIIASAGRQRLRVAMSTLRKLGLAEALRQRDGGYGLVTELVVRRAETPPEG